MAITTRQTSLLVAEDWTKLYQTFRNADFQSYDYETLRATMVSYLQLYYPEDFNDFIESSEFIALIDMIAFLGQSLAFRADLNARENFIDTAQRRDSILKLARLISYNPKRNINSKGFLKFSSVSTTETLYDSNGLDLSGLVINWADSGNSNWLEQFTIILNAAMVNNQSVGKPSNSQIINGITNEEYQLNLVPNILARFPFSAVVAGTQMLFETVSPTSSGQSYIYEANPYLNAPFNILYKNDNLGNGSVNTGFFLYFVQGTLQSQDFTFSESIPNRVYSINNNNINNSDVWLYSLDSNGNLDVLWQQVPAVANSNVIYNQSQNRNIYQINTRAGDQIDLVFGDGSFANIPQGNYRLYFRTSNALQYKITPDEMQGVVIPVNYISASGRVETINITASLQYTVANATTRESLDDIRQKAPQQFYTQNRMITGEDYNILPYTLFNDVLKIKAVNRTSSGISRYLDVIDVTGKYSSTNIFAQDGMLYKDNITNTFSFDYNTLNDIYRVIYDQVQPIASAPETQQFFYSEYPLITLTNIYWHTSTTIANGSTGFFVDSNGKILQIGSAITSNNQYIVQGSIVRFSAGSGNYFDANNYAKVGTPSQPGDKYYIYAAIELVVGDGTNGGQGNLSSGQGPVTINAVIPRIGLDLTEQTVIGDEVFAVFNNNFTNSLVAQMVSYIQAFANFGLRYDVQSSSWKIIAPQDLNKVDQFDLTYAGNTSGQALDASWIISFQTVGQTYTVSYRGLNYVFQSVQETNFYYDGTTKIFDAATGITIRDQIKVLKVNSNPDSASPLALDYIWYIYKSVTNVDGYVDINKILLTFSDTDNDGIPDNPELFDLIVNPNVNTNSKYVFFKQTTGYDNFAVQEPVDNSTVVSTYTSLRDAQIAATLYQNGQLFYIPNINTFYKLKVDGAVYTLIKQTGTGTTDYYIARVGRQNLYFQYRHNSPNNRRVDPSPNNIIDLYILTQQYAIDYIAWAQDITGTITEPTPPGSEELESNYNTLDNYKAISDTIIYNPAAFKPLFGSKAISSLQAQFKVVKNPNVVVSDNDIKTSVIAAINQYFDTANWDFGETFYFSELAAYLHVQLVPKISSVIIVPANQSEVFGSLMQVNANINEIITSCATVNDVKIITAITAAQINTTGIITTV
jgi:hypothetical protein